MSHTLFISDLHLSPDEPAITQAFKEWLVSSATEAEALYILGDFFETWIGDDDCSLFHKDIIDTLHYFTSTTKVPTYFMRGNRDFLIGQHFAKKTGVILIEDPTLITLYGQRVLLLHGDLLCTLDTQYQSFRKKRFYMKLLAAITPLYLRRHAAQYMRQKSKQHQRIIKPTTTNVCPNEVDAFLNHYQADLMIHGHTHCPAIHDHHRIVLGAWHHGPSVLHMDEHTFNLRYVDSALHSKTIRQKRKE